MSLFSIQNSAQHSEDERRRRDWQSNDRRQKWPWVVDSNDRRTGRDRRLESSTQAT